MSTKFVKFKEPKQSTTLHMLSPLLVVVMFDIASWCYERGIDYVITDTISTIKKDTKIGRKHSGHRDKRAFDMRSWTFTDQQKQELMEHFNNKYKHIAQISGSDLVARLIVLHGEGNSEHFHVGLHKRYKVSY